MACILGSKQEQGNPHARHDAAVDIGNRSATSPALAQELTGTLKKIKELARSPSVTATPRYRSPITTTSSRSSAFAMTCAARCRGRQEGAQARQARVKLNPVTSATRIPLMANGTVEPRMRLDHQHLGARAGCLHHHALSHDNRFVAKRTPAHQVDELKGKTVVSTSARQYQALNEFSTRKRTPASRSSGQGPRRGLPGWWRPTGPSPS